MEKITRLNYDFNTETQLFEIRPQIDFSKISGLRKGIENVQLKINSSKSGLVITGNKANGKTTEFGPAYELKNYPGFYGTKSREFIRGKEFVYVWLVYPHISKIDLQLALYLLEEEKVDETIYWEAFDKYIVTGSADYFLSKNLKMLIKEDKLFK